jgi:hypothetical protein
MRATGNGNDLLLLQRTAWLICDWHRRTAVRAAAQRGTAQVLCWQSRDLCDASARLVAEAGRIEAQLTTLRRKRRGEAAQRGPHRGAAQSGQVKVGGESRLDLHPRLLGEHTETQVFVPSAGDSPK